MVNLRKVVAATRRGASIFGPRRPIAHTHTWIDNAIKAGLEALGALHQRLHPTPLTASISYAWVDEGGDPAAKRAQREWVERLSRHLEWAGFTVTVDVWNNMNTGDVPDFVA